MTFQVVTMSPAQLAAATAGASGGEGGLPSNVKVVKIPAGSAAASAFQTGSPVSLAGSPATGYSVKQGPYIKPPGAQVKNITKTFVLFHMVDSVLLSMVLLPAR